MIKNLNSHQKKVLKELLHTKNNLFISGAAGSGKSHVLKLFRDIKKLNNEQIPMIASTGVASLLVNGITFNSYFGLGILAGGVEKTIEKALQSRSLCERIIYTDTVIIDEVSMISATTFKAANLLCQKIRQNKSFFGGIRIIAVGDFFQLAPFSDNEKIDWVFKGECWKKAKIKQMHLTEIMRTKDKDFLEILAKVRFGIFDSKVKKFLDNHIIKTDMKYFAGPRIFSRNLDVDRYNQEQLSYINEPIVKFLTQYIGEPNAIDRIKENLIIPEELILKKGALVMMRVNNFNDNYVNGTLGYILRIESDTITIKKNNGEIIKVKKHIFEQRDGSGEIIAKARIFPLTLAWAMTIHKSQGASLDTALISLERLWLHGQAYTALSRLSNSEGLFITGYDKNSFIVDKDVIKNFKNNN